MTEDKVTLARKRAELVEKLTKPLSIEDRNSIQAELTALNAQIKALNTTEAAKLKAAADRRKAAGLAEAQANAARARVHLNGSGAPLYVSADELDDDDPGQTAAIDAWIVAVLQRGGVKVHRAKDGNLDLVDAPAKWVAIIQALCGGVHAAARGEELPEVTSAPKTRKRS